MSVVGEFGLPLELLVFSTESKTESKAGRTGKGRTLGCGDCKESRGVNGPGMVMMGIKVITRVSTKSYKLWAK